MIDVIEKTLLNGGDLEAVRINLLNQANNDRINRNAEIEHDYRIALLIQECLTREPKGSAGYSCAKGIMNRLKLKYTDTESQKVIRRLYKDVNKSTRKEQNENDSEERKQAETTNPETIV